MEFNSGFKGLIRRLSGSKTGMDVSETKRAAILDGFELNVLRVPLQKLFNIST